jgi:hypothetical protein
MKMFKRGFSSFVILTFLGLNLPTVAFCEGSSLFARVDKKHITRHEPKILATPEKEIPMVQAEGKKGGKKYLWIGLGTAVLLGLVAAGGGGGGGGGDTPPPPAEGSGNISFGW